jgi:O-antigen ligase
MSSGAAAAAVGSWPFGGRSRPWAVIAAIGCALAGLGALAVTQFLGMPLAAPMLLCAVLAIPLLLERPVACLIVLTVVELASPRSFNAGNGVPGVYLATLGLAGAAGVIAIARRRLRPGWSPVLLSALLLLGVQAAAALVGRDPADSLVVVEETAKHLVWLALLITLLLASPSAPRAVVRALVVTLAVLAGLTIVQEFVLGNATTFAGLANVPLAGDLGAATARHAGPQLDVNFWGRVLVLGLPFALSMTQMATTRLRTLLWLGAAVSIFGGIVLTGSRGGLLAAFAAVGAWALLAGGRYARMLWLAPVFLALLLVIPGVGSRLDTLSMLSTDSALDVADPSLEGRLAAQQVAIEMVVDAPVLGIGPGNFLAVEPEYMRRLSLNAPLVAPHNSYLEAAAEGGLLGLVAWVILLGTAVVMAWRARLIIRSAPAAEGGAVPLPLVNGTLAALAGWAVASAFLHLATFRTLLLVVALAAALDIWARRIHPRWRSLLSVAPGAKPAPNAKPGLWAWTAAGTRSARWTAVLVVVLLGLAATTWQLGGGAGPERTWSASTSLQLVVRDSASQAFTAYDQEALTRTAVIRTFAGITADQRFSEEGRQLLQVSAAERARYTAKVENTAPSGLIVIVASGPDRATTQAFAANVRVAAAGFVNSLSQLYGVQSVEETPVLAPVDPPVDRRGALVPLGLAVLLLLAAWVARKRTGKVTLP